MQLQNSEPLQKIMLARYYQANLGRFMAVDPGDDTDPEPQSWNKYAWKPVEIVSKATMFALQSYCPVGEDREPAFYVVESVLESKYKMDRNGDKVVLKPKKKE